MSEASRTVFDHPNDLLHSIGQPLGTSEWRLLSQDGVDTFAEVTGDEQWIHVDPERAAAGPFGTTIVHGFFTLALCPLLVAETIEVRNKSMGINYGLNRVRFPSPIPVGKRVRGQVVLLSAKEISAGVQVVLGVTIEVEGGEKPACVAELVTRIYAGGEISTG